MDEKVVALITLVAISTIDRGTERYGPGQPNGERFELTKDEAEPLIACGAAVLASDFDASATMADAALPAGAALAAEVVANYRALAAAAEADKKQLQEFLADTNAALKVAEETAQQALNTTSFAQEALLAEKTRADALQAELDALKAAAAAAAAPAPAATVVAKKK